MDNVDNVDKLENITENQNNRDIEKNVDSPLSPLSPQNPEEKLKYNCSTCANYISSELKCVKQPKAVCITSEYRCQEYEKLE